MLNNNYKDSLQELCVVMIDLLNKLKENGEIDEEEYHKHIRKKKEFLGVIS